MYCQVLVVAVHTTCKFTVHCTPELPWQILDLFYLKLSICKQTQPLFWSQVFGDLGAISFTIYKLGDGKHFNLLNGNS